MTKGVHKQFDELAANVKLGSNFQYYAAERDSALRMAESRFWDKVHTTKRRLVEVAAAEIAKLPRNQFGSTEWDARLKVYGRMGALCGIEAYDFRRIVHEVLGEDAEWRL